MPKITYIEFNGTAHEVDVSHGNSLMQGAVDNMIDGVVAECGGACSCATCHCYIDDPWLSVVGEPNEMEASMLDVVDQPKSNSRLSCQIEISDALDGLVVHLPKSQY